MKLGKKVCLLLRQELSVIFPLAYDSFPSNKLDCFPKFTLDCLVVTNYNHIRTSVWYGGMENECNKTKPNQITR